MNAANPGDLADSPEMTGALASVSVRSDDVHFPEREMERITRVLGLPGSLLSMPFDGVVLAFERA